MSKQSVRFFESVAPVRLYLEDVEEIVARLQELSPEADITLATSGHEFVTVEELSGLGQHEVSELEIRCLVGHKPFHAFLVSIGPKSVSLCRAGDTPADRRILRQVEALLLARRRPWQWRDRLLTSAGVIGPLSAFALMLARSDLLPWLFYVGAVLTGVSLSLPAVYLTTERWSKSKVVLVRRQEHRAHWGDVATALITVALVVTMALVTMLLAFLAGVLFPPTT
jgi:hypothetical protein